MLITSTNYFFQELDVFFHTGIKKKLSENHDVYPNIVVDICCSSPFWKETNFQDEVIFLKPPCHVFSVLELTSQTLQPSTLQLISSAVY